jgi:hypothetical protein
MQHAAHPMIQTAATAIAIHHFFFISIPPFEAIQRKHRIVYKNS